MPSDALEALRDRLCAAAEARGLFLDPARLCAGTDPHLSLFSKDPAEAEALFACFSAQKELCHVEMRKSFLCGSVSESFLHERLCAVLPSEGLPPFVFPQAVSEDALFSFPLYPAARLEAFFRTVRGAALCVPPKQAEQTLLWAILTASSFPNPEKRAKRCIEETAARLFQLPAETRNANAGLCAAARMLLFEMFSV